MRQFVMKNLVATCDCLPSLSGSVLAFGLFPRQLYIQAVSESVCVGFEWCYEVKSCGGGGGCKEGLGGVVVSTRHLSKLVLISVTQRA